jgi:demethylmenaquinone methyltransferase/2-methoxy-6-polyprenyl-1,4-benzoquinol methylase
MYTRIDRGYELVNHLFSLYLDTHWRREAARLAARQSGRRWLDLCSGTGEMALALSRLQDRDARVIAVDFSLPMLRQAQAKGHSELDLVLADAADLPFGDGTFDLVTIAFATRNLEGTGPLSRFFAEVLRVLAPGGSFIHLETSQPEGRLTRALFHGYVRTTITPIGTLVTGVPGPYRFLTQSVLRFRGQEHLAAGLTEIGFDEVTVHPLLFGAVAIHHAVKRARGES